nr:polysialyltransferase family glycosyltransferase [uncultured Blautia sp.]
MKELFIADTPYQIFNCMNLQCYKKRTEINSDADIFVIKQFSEADEIVSKIHRSELFNHIFELKPLNRFENRSVACQWSIMLLRLIFPGWVIKEQIGNMDIIFFKNKYDIVNASYFNPIVASILKLNCNAVFNHMEDGTGSYFADLVNDATGWKYRLVSKITHSGSSLANIHYYYLNCPELYSGKKIYNMKRLPSIDEEFLEVAGQVFDSRLDTKLKDVIWLSDPIQDLECGEETKNITKRLIERFESYRDILSVRLHPREKEKDLYRNLYIDKSSGSWEMLVSKMDVENKTLIALFSTAQFTPKILFDKEPRLIFLNDIFGVRYVNERRAMINSLRNSYSHPERIMTPKSEEELFGILDACLSGNP